MIPTSTRRFAVAALGALLVSVVPGAAAHAAVTVAPGVAINRFSGTNRYGTAAQLATSTFSTASTVVVASGTSFADALSGNYLAGSVNGPILLTDPDTLSPETAAALRTLKTSNVLLLGGQSAVSANVASAIAATPVPGGGMITVKRISGPTRYGTDLAVVETPAASYVGSVGGKKTALLTSGLNFPDALAGGALAYGAALPILLTDPAVVSPEAAAAIRALGIQQVVILGGTAAVSAAVQFEVGALGVATVRLSGPTRTGTAAAVATYAGVNLGWGAAAQQLPFGYPADAAFTTIDLARGDDAGGGADALALGPHAGQAKAPILLTASVDDPSSDVYYEVIESSFHAPASVPPLANIDVAGGTSAVSAANAQLITVASGGGAVGTMNFTPTSVTSGMQVTATSIDPCPPAPAGDSAFALLFLLSFAGNRGDVVVAPLPSTGGAFTLHGMINAGLAAGQYQSVVSCGVTFAGDPTFYPYAGDLGPMITLS